MANEGFWAAFNEAYGEGRDDYRSSFYEGRIEKDQDIDAPRIKSALGTNASLLRLRDYLGISDPVHRQVRLEKGMGPKSTFRGASGQLAGTFAADLTQDHTRELWWLLNAPQAIGNVTTEYALNEAAPDLYRSDLIEGPSGKPIPVITNASTPTQLSLRQDAVDMGLIDKETDRRKRGVFNKDGYYAKRRFQPGHVASLSIPTGIAINAGIGLLNPVGGSEGYHAVLPSKEDPTKTSNMLGEVVAKYFLGRTGNLLPWEEFKKVRPDVSKNEYMAYKAFKWDKNLDYDPTDGNMNLAPLGILKATAEGIHGPEIQFLGRSLPVTTAATPFLGALAGTTAGAEIWTKGRFGRNPKNAILGALASGLTGLTAGGGLGIGIENERRRRNALSNEASVTI